MYIGNSNLTSSFRKGDLPVPFAELWWVWVRVVLVEECEDDCEEEYEEDGGAGGGLSPFPLPPHEEPSPFGGLELSPCNMLFLSS